MKSLYGDAAAFGSSRPQRLTVRAVDYENDRAETTVAEIEVRPDGQLVVLLAPGLRVGPLPVELPVGVNEIAWTILT